MYKSRSTSTSRLACLTVTFTSLDPITGQAPTGVFDGFLYPESQSARQRRLRRVHHPAQGRPGHGNDDQPAGVRRLRHQRAAEHQRRDQYHRRRAADQQRGRAAGDHDLTRLHGLLVRQRRRGPRHADYNVYVSDDGGSYTLWQSDTTARSATYTGQVGHTYRFYSVATDNVGLVQPIPLAPQATTSVINAPPPPPPPLVSVQSVYVEKIEVGKGKKAKKETVLVLQMSGRWTPAPPITRARMSSPRSSR